jgi:hypothetical protein
MDIEAMSREDLIVHLRQLTAHIDNVIVLWGGKRELKETLQHVAQNPDQEFTEEEAADAIAIVQHEGALEELIKMLRDSFERGGINFAISEKMSAIMQTVGGKYRKKWQRLRLVKGIVRKPQKCCTSYWKFGAGWISILLWLTNFPDDKDAIADGGQKECLEVKMQTNSPSLSLALAFVFSLGLVAMCSAPGRCETGEAPCAAMMERWTSVIQQVENKVNELAAVQQVRVERVTQRPLLETSSGKTIARQIADALQVKEEMVNTKRRECREILAQEEQIFSQIQGCFANGRDAKNKDAKKWIKLRSTLLERAVPALADVKEVEGKETGMPYSEAMRGPQDMYRGAPNNNWQSYQQMYRRWWGYWTPERIHQAYAEC